MLIGKAIIKPANAPYTVELSEEDVIEQTLSQPNTEAYANPAIAPIAVIISVIFMTNHNNIF